MNAKEQLVIGENFLQVLDYIQFRHGTRGLAYLRTLCDIDFENILEEKFYPFEDYLALLTGVLRMSNDYQITYKIGLHRAKNLVLVKGLKSKGPDILEKVADAWHRFNNFGDVSIVKHDDGKITFSISNYESHPLYCKRVLGFLTGLLKNGNRSSFRVKEVNCVCHGKEACEFVIEKCA